MLKELLHNNKEIIGTLEYARLLTETEPSVRINVPLQKAALFYEILISNTSKLNSSYVFLKTGQRKIKSALKKQMNSYTLFPYWVKQLRAISNEIGIEAPSWLPSTMFDTEKKIHYFEWPTVGYEYISNDYFFAFSLCLNKVKSNFPRGISNQTIQVVTMDKPDSCSQFVKDLSEVEFSKYVAKKYLSLLNSATTRDIEITISITDLYQLLKNPTCYFTGEELICSEVNSYSKDTFPDRYLTLDRLENNKGYVPGNVVVCGHKLNQLKGSKSVKEFEKQYHFCA